MEPNPTSLLMVEYSVDAVTHHIQVGSLQKYKAIEVSLAAYHFPYS